MMPTIMIKLKGIFIKFFLFYIVFYCLRGGGLYCLWGALLSLQMKFLFKFILFREEERSIVNQVIDIITNKLSNLKDYIKQRIANAGEEEEEEEAYY